MKNSYYDDYEVAQVILKYEKELSDAKQNLSPLGRQRLFDEFTRELRRFTKKQYKVVRQACTAMSLTLICLT